MLKTAEFLEMSRPVRKSLISKTYLVFIGFPLLANAIAVSAGPYFMSLSIRQEEMVAILAVFDTLGRWTSILQMLPFIVAMTLIGWYIRPVIFCLKYNSGGSLALTQRRLLNASFVVSLFGSFGWLVGLGQNYALYFFLNSWPAVDVLIKLNLNILLTGSFVFVISYYGIEYMVRKHFVTAFFPDRRLSNIPCTFRPSVFTRFAIYLFAVLFFPLVFISNVLLTIASGEVPSPNWVAIVLGVHAALAVALTYLLARSYQSPLIAMAASVHTIKTGRYDVETSVVSNDELGILGEGINEMARGLLERERIKDTFGRLVDPAVRDLLLSGDLRLGGEVNTATILFADIRSFTTLSENCRPRRWLRG